MLVTSRGTKIEKNSIELGISKEQKVITNEQTKVLFDTIESKSGSKFSFADNGVKIGKGISKIKVSYTLWIENHASYCSHHIMKNDDAQTYNIVKKISDNNEHWNTVTATKILNVEENDIITLNVRFNEAHSTYNKLAIYNNSNRLIVEEI